MSEVKPGDQFKSDLDTVTGSVHTGKGDIRNTYYHVLQVNRRQDEPLGPRLQGRPDVAYIPQPQDLFTGMWRKRESQIEWMRKSLIEHYDALRDIWDMMRYLVDIPPQLKQRERYHKQKVTEWSAELERLELSLSGPIHAGPLTFVPDERWDETVSLPLIGNLKGLYMLEVIGDSMIEDGIHDGDIVIVRHQRELHNGEIGVIRLRDTGETTLKRFYWEKEGRVRLQPANPTMRPIYIDDPRQVEVQGKVVAVLRQ